MNEAKLETIRAMLRKAEDPAATPAEAEAFTAMAMRLLAKHGIDAALLAQDPATRPDGPGKRTIVLEDPYAMPKAHLLNGIAVALRCQAVRAQRHVPGGTETLMHVVGFEADLERVELLYTSLLLQAINGVRHDEHLRRYNEGVRAYRHSWYLGFAAAVGARLKAAEQVAADEATPAPGTRSVALVLADRSREVTKAYREMFPNVSTRRSSYSGSGGGAGQAAGRRADLGAKRVGAGSSRAISR